MAMNKNIMLLLGVAAVGGAVWYFSKNSMALPAANSATAPTYKKTNESTLAEMRNDLIAWRDRGDEGWQGKKPKIVELVYNNDAYVRNLHALLWDIWQPNQVQNFAYKVNSYLQPTSWENSVGKWWELFTKANGL